MIVRKILFSVTTFPAPSGAKKPIVAKPALLPFFLNRSMVKPSSHRIRFKGRDVYCDGIICLNWVDTEARCKTCPLPLIETRIYDEDNN